VIFGNASERFKGKYRAIQKEDNISHVCNEVTSEPTIMRYVTVVRKILKVCCN
jgi:hypothetical protein